MHDGMLLLVINFMITGTFVTAELEKPVLEWSSRHKIAVGAARGLRYLHEDCRVGCIVHRDLRPNNILLTHDFEPMVCVVAVLPFNLLYHPKANFFLVRRLWCTIDSFSH